jgi:hypothetical protein
MTILTKNFADLKAQVEAHVAADEIIQGAYWRDGKGCFIGCLSHKPDGGSGAAHNEAYYGLPLALQRIAENIFEALPATGAKAFFAALPESVGRDGKDLSRVHWQFLGCELRECAKLVTGAPLAVVNRVIAGIDLLSEGRDWPDAAAAAAAADAAAAAAAAADYAAAYAAADAAAAAAAAYAARAAAYAARAARHAADASAMPRAAASLRQRDTLLRLISEAV